MHIYDSAWQGLLRMSTMRKYIFTVKQDVLPLATRELVSSFMWWWFLLCDGHVSKIPIHMVTWTAKYKKNKTKNPKKPIDKEGPIYFSVPEINITWFYYAMLDETICLCKYIFSSGHLLPQLFKETNYFRISSSTPWHMLFFHWNNSLCWERQSWVGKRKKWKNLRIVSFSLNVLYLPLVFWSIFYTVG